MSDVTREYIAGILCAMQVAGDDEASAAIEEFIVQLETEIARLKRPCSGCGATLTDCYDWRRKGKVACCPDCNHEALLTAEEQEVNASVKYYAKLLFPPHRTGARR